ncbi:MAG: polyprenyl synthetase family protein [Nitrospira sp.]|nr:polyprenyl synthetase family protein [bacterium]MBL7048825.1 polyprenyl synthetase family protein [Nitrospira sp.]
MNLDTYLKEKRKSVDTFLKDYIASKKRDKDCPRKLTEVMEYALMAGGKRVRPVLCIASYEAAGGTSSCILPIATSLELIHTYSLIHDDLPAMDDDDFRRGKPTAHKVYGEAMAILAGDALLTDAFKMVCEAETAPATAVRVLKELSHASGPCGMVGGQAVDIMLEGKKAGKKDVHYIHTHKTGALIRGAVRMGALMAKANPVKLSALTEYGEKMGLAFQIIDDVLDITGTQEELGKTAGADIEKGKNTYPSVYGLEKSQKLAETLLQESMDAIQVLKKKAEPLNAIANYILSRRN